MRPFHALGPNAGVPLPANPPVPNPPNVNQPNPPAPAPSPPGTPAKQPSAIPLQNAGTQSNAQIYRPLKTTRKVHFGSPNAKANTIPWDRNSRANYFAYIKPTRPNNSPDPSTNVVAQPSSVALATTINQTSLSPKAKPGTQLLCPSSKSNPFGLSKSSRKKRPFSKRQDQKDCTCPAQAIRPEHVKGRDHPNPFFQLDSPILEDEEGLPITPREAGINNGPDELRAYHMGYRGPWSYDRKHPPRHTILGGLSIYNSIFDAQRQAATQKGATIIWPGLASVNHQSSQQGQSQGGKAPASGAPASSSPVNRQNSGPPGSHTPLPQCPVHPDFIFYKKHT